MATIVQETDERFDLPPGYPKPLKDWRIFRDTRVSTWFQTVLAARLYPTYIKLFHHALVEHFIRIEFNAVLRPKPEYHAHLHFHKKSKVSSIHDPQMGETLARKPESQYVFNM